MSFWSPKGVCSNSGQSHRQKRNSPTRESIALALLCSAGATAYAQGLPPGMIASFDVTQRLEWSDNPDLDTDGNSDFFGRTVLGFGLESVTKVQSFSLDLGTEIEEFQEDNDKDVEFTNYFANLGYNRNTRNALFGLDLNYSETDTDGDFTDGDFDQDGNVIVLDDGTRVSYGYVLRGEVGREAPVGASFDWSYNQLEYKDTNDPDLNDSTLNDFSGRINFRINPRITTSLTGLYNDFDTDDPNGTDRETTGLGVATDLEISPVWTSSVALSYDRIERSGGTNRTDEGVSGSIDVTRALSNGTVGARYSSDVFANDDGRRSFLSVNRDMELPRGDLFLSLGVTGSDTVGTDPLMEVTYRHDLPTGQMLFEFNQRVVVDDDDNEDINTTLRASYDQEINSLSGYGISLALFDRNALDGGDDAQRYDLEFTYRHDLTRDWGLVSGISYTFLEEDNEADRDRTTVFIGLQRSFNWIP